MLRIGRENLQESVLHAFLCSTKEVRMPKFIFQPGLKFECDYMRFFSPFDGAEISSPVSQTGTDYMANFSPG